MGVNGIRKNNMERGKEDDATTLHGEGNWHWQIGTAVARTIGMKYHGTYLSTIPVLAGII